MLGRVRVRVRFTIKVKVDVRVKIRGRLCVCRVLMEPSSPYFFITGRGVPSFMRREIQSRGT